MSVRSFLSDDSGAATLDWVVLSGALVGTGIAVLSTVATGLEDLTAETDGRLKGSIIRTTFSGHYCANGLDGLQAQENQRVADALSAGEYAQAVNVMEWMEVDGKALSDEDLIAEYDSLVSTMGRSASWSQDTTRSGLLECQMVVRGLL